MGKWHLLGTFFALKSSVSRSVDAVPSIESLALCENCEKLLGQGILVQHRTASEADKLPPPLSLGLRDPLS